MQKTEHLARLLHLSATGSAFDILTSLLIATAISACAGEPVMTLAMVDHHQMPVKSNVTAATNVTAGSNQPLPESTMTGSPPATVQEERAPAAAVSMETRLEKPAKSGQSEPLRLVHKNLSSFSRSNVAFSVQAGYGRLWDEQSMLSKISAGHQETGCAYLGANISF